MVVTPLQSPAFWELPELRCMCSPHFRDLIPYIGLTAAVLAYLSEKTFILDTTDIVRTLEDPTPSSNFHLDISQVQAVYSILGYTPMEYLPRSIRIDLTKKALVFDAQLVSAPVHGPARDDVMGVLSLSREFMSRSIAHAAVFDRRVLCYLFSSESS